MNKHNNLPANLLAIKEITMKQSKSLLAVALSLAAFGPLAATINLVGNGSFESGSATSLTGWTLKNNGKVDFSSFGPVPDGLRFIDLDSTKVKGSGFFNNSIKQNGTYFVSHA